MQRSDLYNQILAHLRRATLLSPVPSFDALASLVMLAEQDLNENLRSREMVCIATVQLTGQFLSLPVDYLDAEDMRIQNGPPFTYTPRWDAATLQSVVNQGFWAPPGGILPPGWGNMVYPNNLRLYYTQVGNVFEFQPYPGPADAPWTIEMPYFQRLLLGTTDLPTDTNAVLNTHPACYVFGSLVAAAPMINDPERLTQWASFYKSAIDGANAERISAKSKGSKLVARFAVF